MLLFSLLYGLSQSLHVEAGGWVMLLDGCAAPGGVTRGRQNIGEGEDVGIVRQRRQLLVISLICHASISVEVTV